MRKILLGLVGVVCALFAVPAHAALPAGYTELEYIDMPASTYLLTDVIPTYNGHYELDIQTVNIDDGSAILGGRSSGFPAGIVFSNMGFKVVLDAFSNRRYESDYTIENNTRYKYVFNNQVVTLYRDNVIVLTYTFDGTNANGGQLCINGINNAGNVIGSTGKIDVYSFKAWNAQGGLIANLIPAKNSSGVIGMYDTVNNRFYTNAGSGSFVAGPIACEGERVTYTSATGTVVQNGTPTPTNPITPTFYTQGDMVLRKVGDVADSYDATTGKITRRVGVKVLDGVTAGAKIGTAWNTTYKRGSFAVSDMKSTAADVSDALSSHFEYSQDVYGAPTVFGFGTNNGTIFISFLGLDNVASADTANAWLAQQYANGTPVTIYYPLATAVEETVSASYCQQAIKVASTKYVETQFSDLGTRLAAAVATVNTVVSNTITQAASIATLQSGKQTRPNDIADNNEKCPAGKKCLLVEGTDGKPHWYEICGGAHCLPEGYTELEYIESTGTQYINTGVVLDSNKEIEIAFQYISHDGTYNDLFGISSAGSIPKSYLFRVDKSGNANIYIGRDLTPSFALNNNKHTIKTENKKVYFDNESKGSYDNIASNPINAFLFATNLDGAAFGASVVKIYYTKIWNNGALVRNFVPAKNASGVVGMYDLVNDRFYTNAGTGTFIDGPVAE